RPAVAYAFRDLIHAAELEARSPSRVVTRHTAGDEIARVRLNVELELPPEIPIPPAALEPYPKAAHDRYSAVLRTWPIARAMRSQSDRSCSSCVRPALVNV